MYWKLQNVGNGLFAGFLKKVLMMMFVFNVCLGRIAAVYGNNVRISGEPDVQLNATSDSLSLTFTLSWDNSWRDNFNWDAVWLFVKYKKEGSTDAWSHLYLGNTQVGTANLNIELGNTGSQIIGAFVYPKNKGTFNIAGERVTLKAPLNGLSTSDITDKNVYFAVSAIEMVLIPYGAYYLGDTYSNKSFVVGDTAAVVIDSENALILSAKNEASHVSLVASYPKGYAGFYIMKYELSQEQYCNFLNMLSYTQQKNRIGNNLDNLTRGDYVFGNKNHPSCRNGIAVFSHKGTSQPVVFGCNLNPSEPFFAKDDGQTVACNYMTGADMLSYLDWSGLRPMSELEYEKACRTPKRVVPGEYAWNTTTIQPLGGQSGLSGSTLGSENEIPVSADINANCGTPSFGPVRCGSFGTSSTNQEQSGGTFYGVMEMSGNLGEMCYSVTGGSSLNTSSSNNEYHGDGALATDGNNNVATYWNRSSDATAFSIRGGSFASPDSLLRLSDRSIMMAHNNTLRDSSVTFRGVRSVSNYVDPGKIGSDAICPGLITINSIQDAEADCDLSYVWYVKKSGSTEFELIQGEQREKLVDYDIVSIGTASTVTYTFRRKAISLTGEAYAEFTLTVPNMLWQINSTVSEINACGTSETLIATSMAGEATYEWKYNGTILSMKNTYIPTSSDLGGQPGNWNIVCTMSRVNCKSEKVVIVKIPHMIAVYSTEITFANCGEVNFIDQRDNQEYCTVKIGNQCWMGKNLNIGTIVQSRDFNTHMTSGIQKICYNNNPDNCESHGGLYTKEEAMYGPIAGQINYVPGTLIVQGICPDGWHLPSSSEFTELSRVNNSVGLWNPVLGGCRNYNNVNFGDAGALNKQGIWWVSDNATTVYYLTESSTSFSTSNYAYSWGLSVRCILNK